MCFGSTVRVSLPLPLTSLGWTTTAPSVVASPLRAHSETASSGSSWSRWNVPPGPVSDRTVVRAGSRAVRHEHEHLGPGDRLAGPIDDDAVEPRRRGELQVGPGLVGLHVEHGEFAVIEPEIRLRHVLRAGSGSFPAAPGSCIALRRRSWPRRTIRFEFFPSSQQQGHKARSRQRPCRSGRRRPGR